MGALGPTAQSPPTHEVDVETLPDGFIKYCRVKAMV